MMSFRRPKKPIRPRVVMLNADSDGEDEEMDTTPAPPEPEPVSFKPKVSKPSKSNGKLLFDDDEDSKGSKAAKLLSFDDELDDDGEVFQVKKSSVSRRLIKQRDKEKKGSSNSSSRSKIKTEDSSSFEVVIKKEKSERDKKLHSQVESFATQIKIKEIKVEKKEPHQRILNGREAEAVNMESEDEYDEDDDENGNDSSVKFRRPTGGTTIQEAVRRAISQGQIPDANLIHEARKRKQMAREMGQDFVPVDNVDRFKNEKGRLVREDDDNEQSDEERLDFSSATNSAKIEREKRIEDFNAARNEEGSENESDEERDEWESQQIRKGVSQAKMNNVAKEMFQYLDSPSAASPHGFMSHSNSNENSSAGFVGFSLYPSQQQQSTTPEPKKKGRTQAFMEQTQKIASIEEVIGGSKKITPELIMKQMSDRLGRLKISRERNAGELGRLEADLQLAEKELSEANLVKSGLNSRYIMYQNLAGYVTDCVDCLRCKVPEIDSLEKRMIDLMKLRRDRFAERRRQDVRDQTEEVAATINIMGGTPVTKPPPTNPERTRRVAEREGRRTRRRRLREKEMKNVKVHKDGLSSDDEEPEYEFKAYQNMRDEIITQAKAVFEDVHEDFGTIEGILTRFEEWRENDFDAYKESYAFMCLPKCIAPLIKLQLISWDPLKDGCDLMKAPWTRATLSFAYRQGETIDKLTSDPDCRLLPSLVEKVVLPWINRIVEAKWDPMSGSQTRELVNVLNRLIDEFSISPNGKLMHGLLETIVSRLKDALDNDVYVPIYPKTALANVFTPASVFLSRQFWSSVKLLDNMAKWQGLLSDRPLQILALDALLTRYTLLGIRVASDLSESVERTKGVVNVLPRAWLARDAENEIPNGLQQLSRCLVSLVQQADCTIAATRIAIPEVANILKTIGFNEEAQIILRKYS